jgi:hypothetical protein
MSASKFIPRHRDGLIEPIDGAIALAMALVVLTAQRGPSTVHFP